MDDYASAVIKISYDKSVLHMNIMWENILCLGMGVWPPLRNKK
jgi:hypothetical protein